MLSVADVLFSTVKFLHKNTAGNENSLQNGSIIFFISMVCRQDYRIFFFSFKLFLLSVADVLFSTVKFLHKNMAEMKTAFKKAR